MFHLFLVSFQTRTSCGQHQWLQYFEEQNKKGNNVQQSIKQIDKERDAMVYEIYGLSAKEIKLIENG